MIEFILALLLVVPCFFLWAAIHEYSHAITAKKLVDAKIVEMKLYPHRSPRGSFRWASIRYQYLTGQMTAEKQKKISWAPRTPNYFAIALFTFLPFVWSLSSIVGVIWMMVFGAGVVDYVNGALFGRASDSDFKKVAKIKGFTTVKQRNLWRLKNSLLLLPVVFALVYLIV